MHQAFLALIAYMGVGLLSSIIALVFAAVLFSGISGFAGATIGGGIIFLILTAVIFAIALYIMIQMRAGRNWARITIAVLGGLALLGAVLNLFTYLSGFGLYGGVYATVFLLISVVQLLLLGAALVLMFRPNVNSYFS